MDHAQLLFFAILCMIALEILHLKWIWWTYWECAKCCRKHKDFHCSSKWRMHL